MRRYSLNERYFRSITTQEHAYWLGFLAADGNISGNTLRVNLALRDSAHLDRLADALEFSGPRIEMGKVNAIGLSITCRELARDLVRLGIKPAKSLLLKPWQGPSYLQRAYWRGLFDGDGGFSSSQRTRPNGRKLIFWKAKLSGTREITESFHEYVCTAAGQRFGGVYRHASIWAAEFGGVEPPKAVAGLLYQPGDIALPRKSALAAIVSDRSLEAWRIPVSDLQTLYEMRNELGTWRAVARELGVTAEGLLAMRRRLGELPECHR